MIGGAAAGARNLISANRSEGIEITGSNTTRNQVQGNFIGTDASGTKDLGNVGSGVYLGFGAFGNSIGGSANLASVSVFLGNLISGNNGDGVTIRTFAGSFSPNPIANTL